MSTFEDREISCPQCEAVQTQSIAKSLNGPRAPEVVAEILADRFQRFSCARCEAPYTVDHPLIFLDFEEGMWIGMFPQQWERRWIELEHQPMETWRRNMIDNAPPVVRSMSEGFRIRTVFGLAALRDKLVCFGAGLDDAFVEMLKLDLLRSTPGLVLHPAYRPSLIAVTEEALVFAVMTRGEDSQDAPTRLEVPRARFEQIQLDPVAWAAPLQLLTTGPYVDLGRIMLGQEVAMQADGS